MTRPTRGTLSRCIVRTLVWSTAIGLFSSSARAVQADGTLQPTDCLDGFALFAIRHEGDGFVPNDGNFELEISGSGPIMRIDGRVHGNQDVIVNGSNIQDNTPGEPIAGGFYGLISAHAAFKVSGGDNVFENSPDVAALGEKVELTGSSNVFNDGIDYTTTFIPGSGNTTAPATGGVSSPPLLPPLTFDIADYAPGGSAALAAGGDYHTFVGTSKDFTSAELAAGGLWYLTGPSGDLTNVIVKLPNMGASTSTGITIVTTGTIDVSGGDQQLRSFVDDLLFFSDKTDTSSSAVIITAGSGVSTADRSTYDGAIYGPNGLISLGGGQATYTSTVIGDRLTLSGSDLVFQFSAGLCVPDLSIEKTASPTSVSSAGDVITYTITVENTGEVGSELSNVTVTDPLIDGTVGSGTGSGLTFSGGDTDGDPGGEKGRAD